MPRTVNARAVQQAVSAALRQSVKSAASASVFARRAVAATPLKSAWTPAVGRGAFATGAGARLFTQTAVRPAADEPQESKIWDYDQLKDVVENKDKKVVVLVDSREPHELQNSGKIPGAINIPVSSSPDCFFLPKEEFENRFGCKCPSRDTELVFYCKAGIRGRAAAELAKKAGFKNVGEYPGSFDDWCCNGGKTEKC